jgi:branched-chain amino acid aminotransferase
MPITEVEKIWKDGELVVWADANVHVLSHAVHYGSGVFEGIRAYETARGPAVWHLD